jgi:glycosyltransferase involved in cell wall biosynthesis
LKRRDLPVVFTYHIPGITCPRGTLLRYGRSVCDGVWGLHKCSRCALHAHGLIKPLSQVLGSLPPVVGRSASALGWQGRAATVLRTTELQALRQRALVAFFAEVDQVVAVSQWVRQMLLRNGVPSEKITLSPHGIAQSSGHQSGTAAAAKGSRLRTPVRVGFVGRLYPIKGAHVLIEALRQRPDLPLELDLFGVIQDGTSRMYEQELRRSASGDTRVRFLAPLPAEDVVPRLREYDFLAVPSQCVETGPLVVLEASAAGIPVIGSNLGGISELVEHEQNGLLVDAADTTAWIRALERICCEPALACRLRAGVRLPRAMSVVADEMIALYHKAIEGVPCVARI